MTKVKEYESKATVTTIKCNSRISLKIKDNFYTIEYGEERTIPEDANVEKERQLLWDDCNNEVDRQAEEIKNMFN